MSLMKSLFKWAIPGLFFIFVFSTQLLMNNFTKFRRWLDSNCGPLVSEATALPTEPQPLALMTSLISSSLIFFSKNPFLKLSEGLKMDTFMFLVCLHNLKPF